MNISAKFNKKPSNECSDISVKNTNVNFLLHTKSSHLFLHNRKKKYSQHVVLLGQRKHLSMFEKYFSNRSVCRSWLQSRPNNILSLSDLHVFTGCQLTNQNCCSCLQGEIDTCRSASIRGYNQRIFSVVQAKFETWQCSKMMRWTQGCHSATATANTLTTQYMVRFSHLTVQLPENPQTSRGNYSKSYMKYMFLWFHL